MALVYGSSQAWKAVLKRLDADAEGCHGPARLAEVIRVQQLRRPRWQAEAADVVHSRVIALRQRAASLPAEVASLREQAARNCAEHFARLEARIESLAAAGPWPVRLFNRWFRIPSLRRWQSWFVAERDLECAAHGMRLVRVREELGRLERYPGAAIADVVRAWSDRLRHLETVAASPEHAGAIAELRMADLLTRGLPDDYAVLHDVTVDMGRWVHADGEHRRTAQVDHLVVGPTGVFVIEDKLWSAAFAERGDYHDPFGQVRWAGKLCHFWLSERSGRKVRVREVIATSGRLPPKPAWSYARILRPEEVCGYIRLCKTELDRDAVASLVTVLRAWC